MAGKIRKAIETSAQAIKGIVDKVWNAVKGKPRSERGTKAEVEKKAIKQIAEKTGRSEKQIRDIQKGKRPGRNLLEPLKKLKRGRKAEAPPKDKKKITRKPAKPEKPAKPKKEKPKKKPPEKPPEKAPTRRIKVTLRGEMGPYNDDEYIRQRTISKELSAELTARFLEAWEKDERSTALGIVTGAYFNPHPGYIRVLDDEPEIEDIEDESEGQ